MTLRGPRGDIVSIFAFEADAATESLLAALTFEGREISFAEFDRHGDQMASALPAQMKTGPS